MAWASLGLVCLRVQVPKFKVSTPYPITVASMEASKNLSLHTWDPNIGIYEL